MQPPSVTTPARAAGGEPAPKVLVVATLALTLRLLLLDQLRYLLERGWNVVTASAAGPDTAILAAAGLRHAAVPLTRQFTRPHRDLVAFLALWRLFRRERPDIVHTHTPRASLIGQLAARAAGVPIVIDTFHGLPFGDTTGRLAKGLIVGLLKIAGRQSDLVLSQNPLDTRLAAELGIVPAERLRTLGNGIDLERFDGGRLRPASQADLARELGVTGCEVVGFVGRLDRAKGLRELCAAFRLLRERRPAAKLLVVGPIDPDGRNVMTPDGLCREFGLPPDVCIFTGQRDDIPELLGLMQVVALPSHREGFPRAAMEAAAMGLPVVASDERGCRQTVVAGETGLLVRVGSVLELAQALESLLSDPDRRQRMGRAALELAHQRFDQRLVFSRVATAYGELLAARREASAGSTRLPLRPYPVASEPD